MTTVNEFIADTLRKLTVQGIPDNGDPEQTAHALRALNRMLHGWKLRGVDVAHVDVTLSDTFPLDEEYEEGAMYILASRISPDYSRPLGFDADDWFRGIQAAYMQSSKATIAPGLLDMPSQRHLKGGRLY